MNSIIDFIKKLFGIDQPPPPPPPDDPCEAPACKGPRDQFAGARARFISICNTLRTLRTFQQTLLQILSVPWWVILIGVLIAIIVGGLLAVLIWGLIAIWGISWLLFFVVGAMIGSLAQSLADALKEMGTAAAEVIKSCPENCRGDLSIPVCAS